MPGLRSRLLLTLALNAVGSAKTRMFELDCTDCPESCNNDCYSVYVAGKPDTLHYDKQDNVTDGRATAAGCGSNRSTANNLGYGRMPCKFVLVLVEDTYNNS